MFKSLYQVKEYILSLIVDDPSLIGPLANTSYLDLIYNDIVDGENLPQLAEGETIVLMQIKSMVYTTLSKLQNGVITSPENCTKLVNWFIKDLQ